MCRAGLLVFRSENALATLNYLTGLYLSTKSSEWVTNSG